MLETLQSHTLHPRYLNSDSRVLDIGGCIGQFGHAIHERFGCKVIGVEADPDNVKVCQSRIGCEYHHLAISDDAGMASFHRGAKADGGSLLDRGEKSSGEMVSVQCLTLPQLMERIGWQDIDLLKIDVEGIELALFDAWPDSLFERIGQITIEWHDFHRPNAMYGEEEVHKRVSRLKNLGWDMVKMSRVATRTLG